MPAKLPTAALLEAELAVQNAQDVRALHRKRSQKGEPDREYDLKEALRRVKRAMKPLRSEIGKFPYGPQTDDAEVNRMLIRGASQALQRERRKLWKMMQKPKRRRRTP
jgi:hypothetical protein